jgi:hypothetical protein
MKDEADVTTNVPPAGQPSTAGTLNLVLHGLFGIVLWETAIELLVPQMDDHVFIAGTWLKERRLKQSASYLLEGVDMSGNAQGQIPQQSLALRGFRLVDRNPEKLFCSIFLPFPKDVRRSRIQDAAGIKVEGKAAFSLNLSGGLSLIQVFRYPFNAIGNLTLGPDLRWTPQMADGNVVNFHIFAESAVDESSLASNEPAGSHLEEAFQNMVRLFPGMDLSVSGSGQETTPQFITDIGLPEVEQVSLGERTVAQNAGEAAEPFGLHNCPPMVVDNR